MKRLIYECARLASISEGWATPPSPDAVSGYREQIGSNRQILGRQSRCSDLSPLLLLSEVTTWASGTPLLTLPDHYRSKAVKRSGHGGESPNCGSEKAKHELCTLATLCHLEWTSTVASFLWVSTVTGHPIRGSCVRQCPTATTLPQSIARLGKCLATCGIGNTAATVRQSPNISSANRCAYQDLVTEAGH
jgi:hypothetical protein